MEDNLNKLYEKAFELGAARASLFSARDVIVDERARLKCLVPRCPNYGTRMCPPNIMSVSEFQKILSRYKEALLVQMEIDLSHADLIEKYGADLTLSQLFQTPGYLDEMTRSFQTFSTLISRLEAEAFSLGYRFAAGFSGSNLLTSPEKGKGKNSSNIAFDARPSIEAMGIDVFETAKRAGLPISFQSDSKSYYTGLILVD